MLFTANALACLRFYESMKVYWSIEQLENAELKESAIPGWFSDDAWFASTSSACSLRADARIESLIISKG